MYYSQSLIFRIFDSAYRHKRVFWASFITVVLVVVAYGVTRAQKYSAAITIVLASQSTRNPFNPSDVSGSVSLPDHLQSMVTQFQALTSTKEFIEDALTGYDQKPIPLNSPIDVNNNRQLGDFQKSISISSDGLQSMYVQVTYKNPSDTTALVYGVTSAYLNRYKQEQTSYYSSQVDFLTGEIKNSPFGKKRIPMALSRALKQTRPIFPICRTGKTTIRFKRLRPNSVLMR
jgi:uncharacterized protein involved in exopolysaccharide biosynthesis